LAIKNLAVFAVLELAFASRLVLNVTHALATLALVLLMYAAGLVLLYGVYPRAEVIWLDVITPHT
jgi:hypothetical protein